MKKRIISAVLAAVVALSAVPASALPPAVAEEKTETAILEEQETGIQDMAVENAETETSDTSDDTAGGKQRRREMPVKNLPKRNSAGIRNRTNRQIRERLDNCRRRMTFS